MQALLYQEMLSAIAWRTRNLFSSWIEGVELERTIASGGWEAAMSTAACLSSFRDTPVFCTRVTEILASPILPVARGDLDLPWRLVVPSALPYS